MTVSFSEALAWWFRLGCISFGGPAGQIAIMHRELVERRKWIGEGRFLHALNYCMVLPGPEAQQLATYVGWLMHGTWGGVAAGALFVLPSLVLMIALSSAYVAWGAHPSAVAVLAAVKPGVVAVVFAAAWRIARRSLRGPLLWTLAGASLVLGTWLPFPAVVGGAAAVGWLGRRHVPAPKAHAAAPALLGDDDAVPVHAQANPTRLAMTLAVGAGSGGLAWLALDAPLREMGLFFTKAALLTFGGAYAVLPYVFHGAVDEHGWLTAPQMLDGLAFGEATPGPLIMIVAFVGYLGAGAAGACVATLYTFLPSFLFILLGGPLVERTRSVPAVAAPLAAITAAVVGVVLHLGVVLARHALVDPVAIAICAAAGVALVRYDAGVVRVLAACAAVGALRAAI